MVATCSVWNMHTNVTTIMGQRLKKKKYCHCPIMIATFSAWKVYVNVTIIMGQIIKILSLSHNVCTFNVWNVTTIMELFVAKGVFL